MEAAPAIAAPQRLGLHLGLLAVTIVTTTSAGVAIAARPGMGRAELLVGGLGFSLTLLGILLTHEMGHYVFARLHRVDTSLPYVIPAPGYVPGLGLLMFGTFGAVIRMRSPIKTRDALVDVGAAGPIAGAIVALPLLVWGTSLSHFGPSPTAAASFWHGNQSLVALVTHAWAEAHGVKSAAAGVMSFGDSLAIRLVDRWVLGPTPAGQDVIVHPIALAAWFGLLVTCLNLFPIGQLDGGHVTYALFGRFHKKLGRAVGYGLLLMGCFSSISWFVWWLVSTRLVGYDHPEVVDAGTRLSTLRLVVCAASLLLFVLTFVPVPMDSL
ncbi:MAG TPA: site-2 protease family protein [Myxococcales bacterium]|nr:site-2 protease family protein [Myxococcales bacterium]